MSSFPDKLILTQRRQTLPAHPITVRSHSSMHYNRFTADMNILETGLPGMLTDRPGNRVNSS